MKLGKQTICRVVIVAFAIYGASPAAAADYGQFGPFDYYDTRSTPTKAYALVESAHLGPKTQLMLRQGDKCGYWGDLDYTLRAFPNHPRALKMMAEFLKTNVSCNIGGPPPATTSALDLAAQIESGRWEGRTMEYYFETAIKYRPQYTETRVLFARALRDVGKRDQAVEVLQEALKQDAGSSAAHYEIGTLLLAKGDKQAALRHARKAYQLGSPPAALRDQLVAAGIWKGR
jgi:tetratricopeptide (TPR) repeat protein